MLSLNSLLFNVSTFQKHTKILVINISEKGTINDFFININIALIKI